MYPDIHLKLPDWIVEEVGDPARCYPTLEERMGLAVRLAARNVAEGGGPFGAAVFEIESGRLVAPGVNRVVPEHCSLAHAESMAIMVAQQAWRTFDLGRAALPAMELVTSAQPCIQCYGNLWWSGLQRVVIGARREDVEQITGFNEGPLPEDWIAQLAHRSPMRPVAVLRDVLRAEAQDVLRQYIASGGLIYNPGA